MGTGMSNPKTPRPPADLRQRGRAWWRSVHATWELSEPETQIAREIGRALDIADALAALIARDGIEVGGPDGPPKTHPAIPQLRSTQLGIGRLIGQLGLEGADGHVVDTTTTARARWDRGNVRQLPSGLA
jgi:hypothetical protein